MSVSCEYIRHWVYQVHRGLQLLCNHSNRWSIARLALCIIQISYANSVINNAGTKRFIIPRNQRRLNTVDLHANSPNEEAALALKAAGQFLRVELSLYGCLFSLIYLHCDKIDEARPRFCEFIYFYRIFDERGVISSTG